jgi:hypothetical protein
MSLFDGLQRLDSCRLNFGEERRGATPRARGGLIGAAMSGKLSHRLALHESWPRKGSDRNFLGLENG